MYECIILITVQTQCCPGPRQGGSTHCDLMILKTGGKEYHDDKREEGKVEGPGITPSLRDSAGTIKWEIFKIL